MDRKSLERLRLDRRLVGRPGWIAPEEFERELAALPDVAHKVAPAAEPDEAGGSPEAAPTPSRPGR